MFPESATLETVFLKFLKNGCVLRILFREILEPTEFSRNLGRFEPVTTNVCVVIGVTITDGSFSRLSLGCAHRRFRRASLDGKTKIKQLDGSVQTGADQTRSRVNPIPETKTCAEFTKKTPELRYICTRGLIGARHDLNVPE